MESRNRRSNLFTVTVIRFGEHMCLIFGRAVSLGRSAYLILQNGELCIKIHDIEMFQSSRESAHDSIHVS